MRYKLAEVHRFAAPWEAAASLRLHDGDPDAVDAYARRRRLVDGGPPSRS